MSQTNKTLLQWFREEIAEKRKEHAGFISSGACEDFASYKYHSGILKGLDLGESIVLELMQRILQGDSFE